MTTAHIEAKPGDFAELVLMPGDPLRAKALAEGFLDQPRQVNGVRNMLAYTGSFKGKPVSIMGSGMGMPSISIYAHELFAFFGVQTIVRVGTCGALTTDLALGDLLLASAASTDSAMNRERFAGWDYAAAADAGLLRDVWRLAERRRLPVHVGEVFSTDWFYHPDPGFIEKAQAMNLLALDMESAALYALARQHQRRALTALTVSDVIPSAEHFSPAQRQAAFSSIIETILDALLETADA
jgi:purine-nucleoside phosphorylase